MGIFYSRIIPRGVSPGMFISRTHLVASDSFPVFLSFPNFLIACACRYYSHICCKVYSENSPSNEYLVAIDEKKRNMLKKLLSNATVKDKKIVSYQFLNVYSVIAKSPKNLTIDEMLASSGS